MLYYIDYASSESTYGDWIFGYSDNPSIERVSYLICDEIEKDDITGEEITVGSLVRIDKHTFRAMR
mgnify:CR=1 FL=1